MTHTQPPPEPELPDLVEATEIDRRRVHQYAALVPQLREANANLMRATFDAQDSQAAAEERSRTQTEFLSTLAHELRNPLQPIMLANDRIGRLSSLHPDLPMLHGIIGRQVAHLARLVDDLLDASRVSSGKLLIERNLQPLVGILDAAVELSRHAFDNHRQELLYEPPPAWLVVSGDRVRLIQVFSNLLLNASKFTRVQGRIRLGARVAGNFVEVTVNDNGVGIPLEAQLNIFDLFTQGPHPAGLAPAGLGIGLSLVRTITELHGGTVRVHSAGSGSGSEFNVSLPLPLVA
jgi:signal transduction histidine kinase